MNLLQLVRKTLEAYLDGKVFEPDTKTKERFSEKKASFITLTKKGNLRGCIGSLYPTKELWKDIQENAINAGFNDPRFLPITKEELKDIKIEISILSLPRKISYSSISDLKRKIHGKGVILKKGFNSATFLPQVWEDVESEEEFLELLCIKAGLHPDEWKKLSLEVFIYDVEKIKE